MTPRMRNPQLTLPYLLKVIQILLKQNILLTLTHVVDTNKSAIVLREQYSRNERVTGSYAAAAFTREARVRV